MSTASVSRVSGGAYLEQLPEQLRIPVRSLDKNLRLPLAGRTPFQRPDRPARSGGLTGR